MGLGTGSHGDTWGTKLPPAMGKGQLPTSLGLVSEQEDIPWSLASLQSWGSGSVTVLPQLWQAGTPRIPHWVRGCDSLPCSSPKVALNQGCLALGLITLWHGGCTALLGDISPQQRPALRREVTPPVSIVTAQPCMAEGPFLTCTTISWSPTV